MDAKHRWIQILGWLSALAGYGLALLLIRGIYLGVTRGFGIEPFQAFWVALGYLIFFCLAVYLILVGRRAMSIAQGNAPIKARFGWGRIILGAIFLYGNTATRFHLLPVRHLESANVTEATSMKFTAFVIALGCLLLIVSGIWSGFKIRRIGTTPTN